MAVHIHTEIIIDAPPQAVWAVLSDVDSYESWNPYHVKVSADGEITPGRSLVVSISKPNGEQVTIKPHVIRMEPERELTWGGGVRGIFFGEHRFLLEPAGSSTHLIHSEDFTGFAVRYAGLDSIEEGYQSMNRALKERIERRSVSQPRPQ
jgi:hypothetical protein